MQHTLCPGCGAPIEFHSHASIMAVCRYCKSTLLKDADSIKDNGKMGTLLEDYSPIQLGTSGLWRTQSFTVIGRIQLRYSAGLWNEWYLLFSSGENAWLGDSSGRYTLTFEQQATGELPEWHSLNVTRIEEIDNETYMLSELRSAECIGGEGELPFQVGSGWQARVADFRRNNDFITLDYSDLSDTHIPRIYKGQAIALQSLSCQFLRDDENIKHSTGSYKGKVTALQCSSCGSTLHYAIGVTHHINCHSCGTYFNLEQNIPHITHAATQQPKFPTSLELGAWGTIGGIRYDIIGLLQRQDNEENKWTEYLLYSRLIGFLWLIESQEGWFQSTVIDSWPEWQMGATTAQFTTNTYTLKWDYDTRMTYVAGAFNWQAKIGDQIKVFEFARNKEILSAELTHDELTWSLSKPIAYDQLQACFSTQLKALNPAEQLHPEELKSLSTRFMWGIGMINFIPLITNPEETWLYIGIAIAAIYYPAKYLPFLNNKGSS